MEPSSKTASLNSDQLLAEHADALFAFAKTRLRDDDAAGDAVQETFVAALQNPNAYAAAANKRAWLVGILKHKITDHFRKSQREIVASDLAAPDEESDRFIDSFFDKHGHWVKGPAEWKGDPAALLRDKDFVATFQGCLGKLPDRMARVFVLREVEMVESDDTCEQLGITATNLYAILHRARFRLRVCLEQNWFASQ